MAPKNSLTYRFHSRLFSTQDLENLPNDMIMTNYISCQKLDETSRRLKLPHSKVQDEVPSIHWNQWHPENSVRSLSWIIRHSLPTNKLFCCKLDCWTKLNISQALLFKANGSTWPNESCHKRCRANLSVVWDVWNWCTDGKCALSKEGYYFLPQINVSMCP